MKPKKKKAGKQQVTVSLAKAAGLNLLKDDLPRMIMAGGAFMDAIDRSGIQLGQIPPEMIRGAVQNLYEGVPLVFSKQGQNRFIICDPGTYSRMVKSGG